MTTGTDIAIIESAADPPPPVLLVDFGIQHRRVSQKVLEQMAQVMEATSFVVRVAQRNRVVAHLSVQGIGAGIHYPKPIHHLPTFVGLCAADGLSKADRFAKEILPLPIFPGIRMEQRQHVVEVLVRAIRP